MNRVITKILCQIIDYWVRDYSDESITLDISVFTVQ